MTPEQKMLLLKEIAPAEYEDLRQTKCVCILGAGEKKYDYPNSIITRVDIRELPGTDVVLDLESKHWTPLPVGYYDLVIAEHIAEHMTDRIRFIRQAMELLNDNGVLILEVPSWKSECAHQQLEHKSTWGRASFDESYVTVYLGVRLIKTGFRVAWWGRTLFYAWGFVGRMLDRIRVISAYRFYLRRSDGTKMV